jgi:hypothetical protein
MPGGERSADRRALTIALALYGRPRLALLAQSPLVLLMVGYTFVGLIVLGQALGP